jgi:hypothetical protein
VSIRVNPWLRILPQSFPHSSRMRDSCPFVVTLLWLRSADRIERVMKTLLRTLWISFVICCSAGSGRADERIWVSGEINGKPIRIAFDTGAEKLILFPKAAARLGLKVTPPDPHEPVEPGKVAIGMTEQCEMRFGEVQVKSELGVFDLPGYLDNEGDGVLGWSTINQNIWEIDGEKLKIEFLESLPAGIDSWTSFKVNTNSRCLLFQIPGPGPSPLAIAVDTGSSSGVSVAPGKWKAWKAAHDTEPRTLDAYYMPGAGLMIKEEFWAHELALGSLTLTEVPVMEANRAEMVIGAKGYEATLGLAALKRLEMVVDGKKGVVYLRHKTGPAPPYGHNRLGAVFTPDHADRDDDLIAHVVNPSPAYAAGIRDGDHLLKVEELDVTKWRTDPAVLPLSRFWGRPAGSKLRVTVKRGSETKERVAVLKEILIRGMQKK